MKLAEMNTEQMAKALCEMAPAVGRIMDDEDVKTALDDGKKENAALSQLVGKIIPALLDRHFDDVLTVLSVLTGKSKAVIRKQKGGDTIKDVMNCLDTDVIDFFMPSAGGDGKASAQ